MHAVIHSGVKTEVCADCGKGFYRRDHLRKHTQSHITKRIKEEQAALQQMAEQVTVSDRQKMNVPELIQQNQGHSGPIINVAHQEMIIDAVASGRHSSPSPPNDHQIVITKSDQKLTEQELIILQQQQIQQQQQQMQQQQQQPNSPTIAQQEMIIEAVGQQHQSPSPPQVDHHQVVITKLEPEDSSRDNESIVLTQSDAREALGLLHHQPQ